MAENKRGEKCPVCGSTETVRHNPDAGLKPNWLHCNGCARCADTPTASKRGGRGTKADAGDGADDGQPKADAAKQDEANDTTPPKKDEADSGSEIGGSGYQGTGRANPPQPITKGR